MRGKRFLGAVLALAMVLSLILLPASAVTFSDVVNHWARADIEALATDGIVKGIDNNTFAPERLMTACEALLFCSRTTGVTAVERAQIAAGRSKEMETLLPDDMRSWAAEEMAVCLETGIITPAELKAMTDSGAIRRSITREDLAMYLVRAMQLAPLAESLTTYPLSFSDSAAITPSRQPYVYLLNMYGIVQGNESNQFMPKGALSRAEMAVMLRRAILFMEERGMSAELPAYTSYDWAGGIIAAVNAAGTGVTQLTLSSEASGTRSFTLTAGVPIYVNNMLASASALEVGKYARVNLDTSGRAFSVRLGGTLTAYSGTVVSLSQESVTINSGTAAMTWALDRFTEVQAGKNTGGAEVIDLEAGYTNAVCKVDELGHLALLQLTGGTQQDEGLIAGVTLSAAGGQVIQVTSFSGVTQQYTVPASAAVTVNGLPGVLHNGHIGDYVNMRVSDDDSGKITSLNVDTVTQYIQGSVRAYTTSQTVNTVTLVDLTDGRATTYDLLPSAVIRYEGTAIPLYSLERNSFATLRLIGGDVSLLDAYPGAVVTEGILDNIVYGSPILLTVRQDDGSILTFSLPLEDLPTIYRDNQLATIDKLTIGDAVRVSVRFNQPVEIEAMSQNANVTGTITRVVQESSGVTLDLTLPNGESATYSAASGVSVTQDGMALTVYALRVNDQVAMVVSGGQVASIEVTKSATSGTILTGTILVVNDQEETLMLLLSDNNVVTVDVSKASFVDTAGDALRLGRLSAGDTIVVYGGYSGALFQATLVVRT